MLSLSTFSLFIITTVLWTFLLSRNLLKFYPLPHSHADVCNPIKRQKLSKSLGLVDIHGFIIKDYSSISIPILRHIFNLSLAHQYFSAAWKEVALVQIFKEAIMRL
jgi:hypothetical protein